MGVNHFADALEHALIPYDPQFDQRSLGERRQRRNITASDAQFRNTGGESRARMQVGYLSRGDKWAATSRTLISPLRGFFLLDHQDQYAASCKITAQVTRIIPRMRVTDGREPTIFIRGFWEFYRRLAMPTVALRVSDGKLDSRVQQLRIA